MKTKKSVSIIKAALFFAVVTVSLGVKSQVLTQTDAQQLIDQDGHAEIPSYYTEIAQSAFRNNSSLKSVVIPDSISYIGEYAFDNSGLRYLHIGSGLTSDDSVQSYSFSGILDHLRSLTVNSPISISASGLNLRQRRYGYGSYYLTASNLSELNLSAVTRIDSYVFSSSRLESLVIPGSVTSIGYQAFMNAKIDSLVLHEGVETINSEAFMGNQIENLVFPNSVTNIGSSAFYNNQIEEVQFGESLKTIGDSAFKGNRLVDINFPDALESIGNNAFEWNRLETIKVGAGFSGLGVNAFDNQIDLLGVPLENTTIYLSAQFQNTTSMTGLSGLDSSTIVYCQDLDTDNDSDWNCFDQDDDNDSVPDSADAFPLDPYEQIDTDGDGIGNNADLDDDNDGLSDQFDDLPLDATEQHDFDNDGIGNNADSDDDNDGLSDLQEAVMGTNSWLADTDLDGVDDGLDDMPKDANETTDTDGDGIGNNADEDDDNDGYVDLIDVLPTNQYEWMDTDGDGIGNNADTDDDNDGIEDIADAFPNTASESVDTDGDGTGDNADMFPNDPTEAFDTDLDGIGNNADPDDDNDGVADAEDDDPLDPNITIQAKQFVAVIGFPSGQAGQETVVSVGYDVSNADNQLTGIGFKVHYDSGTLTYKSASIDVTDDIIVEADGPIPDYEDSDNDPSTDSYILFGWASLLGNWPNIELPAQLFSLHFEVNETIAFDKESTPINFSKVVTPEGIGFEATNYQLNLLPVTWDFDGNGQADALTDGLILLRYAFGLRGNQLTGGVMASDSTLSTSEVEISLDNSLATLDIDHDGQLGALTDGLLLLRYLFGLEGDELVDQVISTGAIRNSIDEIEQHLERFMP